MEQTELQHGEALFKSYARFLQVSPDAALRVLPRHLKGYPDFDSFLIALSRRELDAQIELNSLFRV